MRGQAGYKNTFKPLGTFVLLLLVSAFRHSTTNYFQNPPNQLIIIISVAARGELVRVFHRLTSIHVAIFFLVFLIHVFLSVENISATLRALSDRIIRGCSIQCYPFNERKTVPVLNQLSTTP